MSEFIPYARPVLDADDIAAVEKVLGTVWLTQGPLVPAFEEKLAALVGTRHAIAVSSGTAALHVAYAVLGIGPGDEIVTSPLTFAATANMAVLLGAEVRFADVDAASWTLDPDALEKAITPRTRAIVPVDFTGHPCAMDEINAIAARHGIPVVVDGAHSLGARYKGRPCGSLAAMTTFSFHAIKIAAAGEGGAVVTDDAALADRMRRLRSHGIVSGSDGLELPDLAADRWPGAAPGTEAQGGHAPWYYEVAEPAWNYRLTDLQCALALNQAGKIDASLARRREIAHRYDAAFAGHPLVSPPVRPAYAESAWHLYVIRLGLERMAVTRRHVVETLRKAGIGAHVHYIPVHLQPFYQHKFGTRVGDCPVAEDYYRRVVTLPLHPGLSDGDVDRVVGAVLETVR